MLFPFSCRQGAKKCFLNFKDLKKIAGYNDSTKQVIERHPKYVHNLLGYIPVNTNWLLSSISQTSSQIGPKSTWVEGGKTSGLISASSTRHVVAASPTTPPLVFVPLAHSNPDQVTTVGVCGTQADPMIVLAQIRAKGVFLRVSGSEKSSEEVDYEAKGLFKVLERVKKMVMHKPLTTK